MLLLSSAQNGSLGLRSDSLHVAIVITDWRSGSPSATLSVAAALHASLLQIHILDVFVVVVDGADMTVLQAIASNPELVFFTNSFNGSNLQQFQDTILPKLCTW